MGAPSMIDSSEVDVPAQLTGLQLKGTLRLLFATLPRRFYPLVGLAILFSLASGGLPPLMTKVLGDAFNAYTAFNPRGLPASEIPQAAKDQLMRSILRSVWQLCALAGGTMLLSTAMITAWIAVGERTASALRQRVYRACDDKSMSWFDQGLAGAEGETGSIGAGGLMARFAREVDDVRVATSQTSGQLLQHVTTMIACTVLALVSRWDLTLIILASIPLTIILTVATEVMAAEPIGEERALTAHASGGVERCINAITTIKAFNATPRELQRFNTFLASVARANLKLAIVWSARIGLSSTLTLAMFTAGFAYGSHLVQAGKCSPGTVITVFWSALTASAQLQLVIQSLNILEKGKIASASLRALCQKETPPAANKAGLIPAKGKARPRNKSQLSKSIVPMGKIRPTRCHGEVVMRNVTFAYPSRPQNPVLLEVNLYLAAGESTYIVGGSGSGKSTIAQLLLRLYTQYSGSMELDEQNVRYLDAGWVRTNVASVDQSPIVFDLSVHDNVALGLCGAPGGEVGLGPDHVPVVSRADVIAACRTALLHDFVQSLPDGYDTQLGARGASLSGGQKQRLSIARAKIRNPPILILDEATSALDPTSRLLVNEAVKSWRRGKTTIIITHDLSSVGDDDFLYFMQDGRVADEGYRSDLEGRQGPFQRLIQLQQQQPSEQEGLTPSPTGLEVRAERVVSKLQFDVNKGVTEQVQATAEEPHSRTAHWARRLSGNPLESVKMPVADNAARQSSAFNVIDQSGVGGLAGYVNAAKHHQRNLSVAASTSSSTASYARGRGLRPLRLAEKQQQRAVEQEEGAVEWLTSASEAASKRRPLRDSTSTDRTQSPPPRRRWSISELSMDCNENSRAPFKARSRKGSMTSSISHADSGAAKEHVIDMSEKEEGAPDVTREDRPGASLYFTLLASWKAQPHKVLLVVGLITCVAAGIVTPVFSFVLGKLLATMGRQNQGNTVTQYALIVLGLAFLDGILNFFRFLIMDWCADQWVRKLRERAYARVLGQDKTWFDKPTSAAGPIVTSIVKDADDAQALVGRIAGQLLMIIAMVGAGLIWAMITGWQLTLVGLAFGPVFIIAMTLQSRVVTRHEVRNKAKREAVAKRFYDMVSNVRGIRSMALEPVFTANFLDATLEAEHCALRAAPYAGFGFGLGEALTYVAEALLYYVGAVLIAKGTYDFERMVIVLNLIIFAVTFAGNVMAYLPGLSKSIQAASDLDSLVHLAADASSELQGHATPQIRGELSFENVHFAYPLRRDVAVLRGINFSIARGERVALVGGSGSGKSTVAALLQRLYEPGQGQLLLDGRPLGSVDVHFLREHMAVVSQHPNLFDVSVADNIAYGASAHLTATGDAAPSVDRSEVKRAACEAQADAFIRSLPEGYDTVLGENASLISGGQAQRLAIARALVRQRARILVLDECTSALDAATQASVADALLDGETKRRGLTMLIVTHKVQLMQRCDRILVLEHGKVVEQGHYDDLIKRRGGAFAQLAGAGEWGM